MLFPGFWFRHSALASLGRGEEVRVSTVNMASSTEPLNLPWSPFLVPLLHFSISRQKKKGLFGLAGNKSASPGHLFASGPLA